MKLQISHEERELLVLALQRWRWDIDDERKPVPVFCNAGQQQACRFTTHRVDEMLARLDWLVRPINEPTTPGA